MQRFVHANAVALDVSFYSCFPCSVDTLCYSSTFRLGPSYSAFASVRSALLVILSLARMLRIGTSRS